MIRHDASNTGFTSVEVAPPLKLAWRVQVSNYLQPFLLASGGVLCTSAMVPLSGSIQTLLFDADGRSIGAPIDGMPVYFKGARLVVANPPDLECYDWKARTLLWRCRLGISQRPELGMAVAQDGRLYCCWYDATAVVSLADGKLLGRTGVGSATSCPTLDSAWIYVPNISLEAIERKTMNLRWDYYLGATYFPLRYGHLVISQGHTGGDMAIDATSRKLAWGVGWARPGAAHCLVRGARGRMLLLDMLEDAVALAGIDPSTGTVAWKSMMIVGNYHDGLAAGSGRFAYVPGGHQYPSKGKGPRGGFYCFEGSTGKELWSYERPNLQGLCMIVSDDCVYGEDGRSLYKFVPATKQGAKRPGLRYGSRE